MLTSPHLCKGISASSTILFPASFSFSALPSFLALFFASSLHTFSLYLFPGLSKDFLLDRDVPAAQSHIDLEEMRAKNSFDCQCAVSGLPPG